MDAEHLSAASSRFLNLAQQFRDKEFRDTYVAAHTRRFLARQMKKFRGDLSQTEFADQLGKQQTIVSRLENPNYSGWTLSTLLEIANKLNVGVVVRFVDFPSFLKFTDNFSEGALHPAAYDEQQVDDFARVERMNELSELAKLLRPTPAEPKRTRGASTRKRPTQLESLKVQEDDPSASSYQSEAPEREVLGLRRPKNSAAFQQSQPGL